MEHARLVSIAGQRAGQLHQLPDWPLEPSGRQGVGQSHSDVSGPCELSASGIGDQEGQEVARGPD